MRYGCCVTERTACSCVSGGSGTLDGCARTLARSGARAGSSSLVPVWLREAIHRERRLTRVGMRPSGSTRITTRNMKPASMRSHPCVPTCIVRYCCSGTSISAPRSGPDTVPTPPRNAISGRAILAERSKAEVGEMKPRKYALRAPAMPTRIPERTYAPSL